MRQYIRLWHCSKGDHSGSCESIGAYSSWKQGWLTSYAVEAFSGRVRIQSQTGPRNTSGFLIQCEVVTCKILQSTQRSGSFTGINLEVNCKTVVVSGE